MLGAGVVAGFEYSYRFVENRFCREMEVNNKVIRFSITDILPGIIDLNMPIHPHGRWNTTPNFPPWHPRMSIVYSGCLAVQMLVVVFTILVSLDCLEHGCFDYLDVFLLLDRDRGNPNTVMGIAMVVAHHTPS
jgi:hypothetical protein